MVDSYKNLRLIDQGAVCPVQIVKQIVAGQHYLFPFPLGRVRVRFLIKESRALFAKQRMIFSHGSSDAGPFFKATAGGF